MTRYIPPTLWCTFCGETLEPDCDSYAITEESVCCEECAPEIIECCIENDYREEADRIQQQLDDAKLRDWHWQEFREANSTPTP